ncbi:PAP2 superfamily protein [Lentilactobacillus sunkii]|jgi:membrane-associated phospholipid phosphatase|uniref:PAP2 superfamily protein n=1 Tax=Lentilactobacillus sunkii TaxID=481719 RepID=A0A1E7XDM8_9LACO|nr:phosphatase PAP2 family protein [Lentilactobacillus sunkii]OFA11223.1 PAP2 superfamily protein [Lentilactobacillus sunkii]
MMYGNEDYMLMQRDPNRLVKLIVSLCFTALLAVSVAFNFDYLQFLDSVFTTAIQGTSPTPGLEHFYSIITFLSSPVMDGFWVFIAAFFLWGFKYKVPALWALLTIGSGGVIDLVVKQLVRRHRPPLHLGVDNGYSFPSGHVIGFFFVAGVLWIIVLPLIEHALIRIVLKALLVVGLVLVMLSRIYLNAHFPTDTIGACLVGYSWLLFAEMLYAQYAPQVARYRFVVHTKI